jgi:hypothetical protein
MGRLHVSTIASLLLLAPVSLAMAQTGTTAAPGAVPRGIIIADHVQAKAQVEAIDYSARTVVLKGEGGKTVELKVGPSAKNFDQVKVGDQVQADFYTSTAIFLRKSSEPPSAAAAEVVEVAAPGEKPAGVVVNTREITATVDAIDPQRRMVTLTGPRGNTVSFKLGDAIENVDQIHKGDQVVVRYTEAVALAVDKS